MATTEDIEARLAAYIDGELDEAGRAEIERHLTSNPHHRKLIGELTRQRDFLRALPLARAPVDVADNLNAQLERAALLGDDDQPEEHIIRISHWTTQFKAMAAVLLLFLSLVAVVYYVVSAPEPNNDEFVRAVDRAPTRAAEADRPDPTGSVLTGDGTPDRELRTGSSQESRTIDGLTNLIPSQRNPLAGIPVPRGRENETEAVAQNLPQQMLKRSAKIAKQQLTIEVKAADPFTAQRNVEQYLIANNIQYTSNPAEPTLAPLDLQASNTGLGARHQQVSTRLKTSAAQAQTSPDFMAERQVEPATQPIERDLSATGAAESGSGETGPEQAGPQAYYVARNLTQKEVDSLYTSISDASQGQVAQISVEPAEAELPEALDDDRTEPPSAAAPAQAADPTTAPTHDAWMGGPAPGPTTGPAADEEASSRARDLDAPPTTQPEAWDQLLRDSGVLSPASATQPLDEVGEERMDVVIVVRGESDDAAEADPTLEHTAPPATQPIADPPTTAPTTEPPF